MQTNSVSEICSWPLRREVPRFGEGEIQVWAVPLDAIPARVDQLGALLSKDEHKRASKFVFERDRRRFIVAHACLRQILGGYVNSAPEMLAFQLAARGKPELAPGSGDRQARFNLAHSGELAVVAVAADREVGVDIEYARPLEDAQGLACRFFSQAESEALAQTPPDQQLAAFYRLWTRKEAYLKATGLGISEHLARVEFSFEAGQPGVLARIDGDETAARAWSLAEISPAKGYFGTVVARGKFALQCRRWRL